MEAEERVTSEMLLPELWLEIMKYLRIQDLCRLSLVSSSMYSLASTPKFWKKSHIRKIKFKNGQVSQFFQIHKFRKIKKLSFSRLQFTEDNTRILFENFNYFDNLEELDLQGVNLSKVPVETLSACCQNLNKLDLTFTKLTPWQSQHLFEKLHSNDTFKLKNVSFKAANLSQVNPQILADVIIKMVIVNLSFTELTKEQLTVLFEKIILRKNVQLCSLEFFSVDLSPVSPRLIGKAVSSKC